MTDAVTADQLRALMPFSVGKIPLFVEPLNQAMVEFAVNTPKRRAHFLAQIAHESGELRYTREIADGSDYEGRIDLGNTQPGDGTRFPGRGLLQATGRDVYEKLKAALGIDCVTNPSLLEVPVGACRSAGWIWAVDKRLNELADTDQFGSITHRINGGYSGLDQRFRYHIIARKVFGL